MSWSGSVIARHAMILRLPMCSSSESMFRKRACCQDSPQRAARAARTGAVRDWFCNSNSDQREGFIDCAINLVQFVRADAIGRQQIHHIAEGAQKNVALKIECVELGAKRRQITGIGHAKLYGGNRAGLPRIGDFGAATERRERLHVMVRNGSNAFTDRF